MRLMRLLLPGLLLLCVLCATARTEVVGPAQPSHLPALQAAPFSQDCQAMLPTQVEWGHRTPTRTILFLSPSLLRPRGPSLSPNAVAPFVDQATLCFTRRPPRYLLYHHLLFYDRVVG